MEGIIMNRHLHKGILVTVSIITALIFSVSGCGMFKSSKTASPEKPFVADNLYIGEKKTDKQSASVTDGQTKSTDRSSTSRKTKVMAQSDSEQQMNGMKKSPAAKGSGKQIKMTGNIYVVKKGDCLWNIAKAVYNKPLKWKAIYKANKKKIKDPNLIYPNQKLIIPDVK
jgi:nucleoid-associated protein YgaU